MIVKLLDYQNRAVNVDVGDIENIGSMTIEVVTGDEVLTVVYKDYTIKKFDSCDSRIEDCFDARYEIYNSITGVNEFNNKTFVNRTTSYWR